MAVDEDRNECATSCSELMNNMYAVCRTNKQKKQVKHVPHKS